MKNYTLFVFALCFLGGLFSCKQNGPKTVNGWVFDATMNNLMVITTNGDTLNISTMDVDPVKVPGVMLNDSVTVIYATEKIDDNTEILKAVELTITAHNPLFYIPGTWVHANPINASEQEGMTLNENRTASSVNMATLLYKKWQLENGKLLLDYESIGNKQTLTGTDTLDIVKLDADSLVLAQKGQVIFRYERMKK